MFFKRFKNLYQFKKYYKKYYKIIILLLIVMFVASGLGVFVSFLMSEQLIGITNENIQKAITYTIYILIAITIHHINWFLWSKFHFTLTKKISNDIRKDIVINLLNTKYSALSKQETGYYLERISDDVNEIGSFLGNVAGACVDMITNVTFLIIIYFLSWQLGIFFTIGILILFVIESIKISKDLKNLELVKSATEKMNTYFNEIIYGIKDIKGFGIKKDINNNFQNINEDLLNKTYKKDVQFALISRVGTYCQWLIDASLVFITMLWLLPRGQITIVVLLLVFNYKGLMYDTVGYFSKIKSYYVNGDYYAQRILEIINSNELENFGKETYRIMKGQIKIQNLNFNYNNKPIFNDLNLTIEPNTLNVLIGDSGSGKSTLFYLLSKYYEIIDNKIYIDNIDINNYSESALRQSMCIVNQEPFIFCDTIYDNIRIVKAQATADEIYNACKLANIHDEILNFENGYNTMITEGGTNLSGGQKQRIELARALLKDSKIILLDEPTSALDSNNQQKLFQTLKQLKNNKTIFIIAHKLNDYSIFDNVFCLKDNKIIKIDKKL